MRSKPQNNVTSQELRIYDLQDAIDRSLYHAIALVTKTSLMHVSELYYGIYVIMNTLYRSDVF